MDAGEEAAEKGHSREETMQSAPMGSRAQPGRTAAAHDGPKRHLHLVLPVVLPGLEGRTQA